MGFSEESQLNSINEERNNFLETLSDILYLKHKKLPYPKVEIPDYFNIQTSETTLTINATKGGIDQFLEKYGSLEIPPEVIDLKPFRDPDRIWGSRRVIPVDKALPDDVCPYRAMSQVCLASVDDFYLVVESLKICFIKESSKELIFYATAPYPEGHFQDLSEKTSSELGVGYDYFDHAFSHWVGDEASEKFCWIFVPLLKLFKKAIKHYSLSELRSYLSEYGPVEHLSNYYLTSALKVINLAHPDTLKILNKVRHPQLTVNQKGWEQFIRLLKILRDTKEWFFITQLYSHCQQYFYHLTPILNKEENPAIFKTIEFIRPTLEKTPCIRIKKSYISGNCYGLLVIAKWVSDFQKSSEKTQTILNQWARIPGLPLKSGCKEKKHWILLEKFEESLEEPFLSMEYKKFNDNIVIRGNRLGFDFLIKWLKQHAFLSSDSGPVQILHSDFQQNLDYLNQRLKKDRYSIGLEILGGFRFSPKYELGAYLNLCESEFCEESRIKAIDGVGTYLLTRDEKESDAAYLDTGHTFIRERMVKKDD